MNPPPVEDDPPPPPDAGQGEQPCPACGHPMPTLRGGTASLCPNCGYKESCCY